MLTRCIISNRAVAVGHVGANKAETMRRYRVIVHCDPTALSRSLLKEYATVGDMRTAHLW